MMTSMTSTKDLIDTCYMLKEDQKYKYTTISKRCNAIYKIQEKGLLPKVDPEFANVDYREGEDFTSQARPS